MIVLGMHRSGTSVIAGIVQHLGVHMGNTLLPPHTSNPLGHFEDVEFLALNDDILHMSGGSWSAPPEAEDIERSTFHFRSRIRALIFDRNRSYSLWGWKDPRTVLTLKAYTPHLPKCQLIVCQRECSEVAHSLAARDGTDLSWNLALCREYNARLRNVLEKIRVPHLTIRYDDLRNNPSLNVAKISQFIGVQAKPQRISRCADLVLSDKELQVARSVHERTSTD